MNKQRNYGLNLELEKQHQKPEDWIFGAESKKCIAQIPPEERRSYLPMGEVQRGVEDMMDCASRGPINILETKFTWLVRNHKLTSENLRWLKESGYVLLDNSVQFSDCFVAQNSGTTRQGNSMIAPLDAIRKQGLIPKKMLPLESWMTWEDYYNPNRITTTMRKLGNEFILRLLINFERVLSSDFEEVYNQDMIDMAGYAWPEPMGGEYPRTEDPFNHVFVGLYLPPHNIFDNYLDSVDGDFIKKLAKDYNLLDFGYRLFITELQAKPEPQKSAIRTFFSMWCREIIQ